MAQQKSAGLAAVLSFFVMGLGQIYNGQIAKGLILIVVDVILWLITVVTVGLGAIILLPVWIWNIYDAYKTAERITSDIVNTQSEQ